MTAVENEKNNYVKNMGIILDLPRPHFDRKGIRMSPETQIALIERGLMQCPIISKQIILSTLKRLKSQSSEDVDDCIRKLESEKKKTYIAKQVNHRHFYILFNNVIIVKGSPCQSGKTARNNHTPLSSLSAAKSSSG